MKTKKLIINGDDFGMHASINQAIENSFEKGILTSASLVANGDAFLEAVSIAKKNPNLGVGIHLTLNGGKPISPRHKIETLLDQKGELIESHFDLCSMILKKKVVLEHIRTEYISQIEKILDFGLKPTHVDGHRHLHLFPPIFLLLKDVLKKFNLNKVRMLNIPTVDWQWMKIKKMALMGILGFSKKLNRGKFKSPDYFLGFFQSGNINQRYIKKMLPNLKSGVTEINFHPAMSDIEMEKKFCFWRKKYNWVGSWEQEYNVLIDQEIINFIHRNGIRLMNYNHI